MIEDPTRINLQTNVTKDRDPTIQRMQGITAHGNVPFDVPFISEIAPNLWQGGCENGLILPHFFKHLRSLWLFRTFDEEQAFSCLKETK